MKLYLQIIRLLFNKFILRQDNGTVVRKFAESMGIVYIKLAQILATQNFGNLFTEADRRTLSSICDTCNPISYDKIKVVLQNEYGHDLKQIFRKIEEQPLGSASVSQVHRATLISGEEVAIKIKRQDITRHIDKDIQRIRSLLHRFGKFVNFKNLTGGDHALNLYLDWIKQETDFTHEIANIKTYHDFAKRVNGKVPGTTKIKIPHLYEDYCTENIIVMEYIPVKTVNRTELTDVNKTKIATALNSYLQLSFWALFNDQPVVFHSDPHGGNICVDDDCNLYFLDMGLLCALDAKDARLCRDFFLTAYTRNYEKLYNMLIPYGNMNETDQMRFKAECKQYCDKVKQKGVTHYFVDLMNVCPQYEINPPDFLFSMAKAFICLNGICDFSQNTRSARQLLQSQAVEFIIKRSLNDCKRIALDGASTIPAIFTNTLRNGLTATITDTLVDSNLKRDLRESITNLQEALSLLRSSLS